MDTVRVGQVVPHLGLPVRAIPSVRPKTVQAFPGPGGSPTPIPLGPSWGVPDPGPGDKIQNLEFPLNN